jgi:archaellum biogenesis ATPase FlaH
MRKKFGSKLTQKQREYFRAKSEHIFFKSNLRFLREHGGFRPTNMHLFLANASGGKSTMVRTLVIDLLECGANVLLWLSEETTEQYLIEFEKSGYDNYEEESFTIYSEVDYRLDNLDKEVEEQSNSIAEDIDTLVMAREIDIIIYDNITTSIFYMQRPPYQQASFAWKLKSKANSWALPMVIIAHTNDKVSEDNHDMIRMNDIKGSKDIINMAEFVYVMQSLFVQNERYNFLKIAKHRSQSIDKSFFQLVYHKKAKIFYNTPASDFEEFKKIFKERRKLV